VRVVLGEVKTSVDSPYKPTNLFEQLFGGREATLADLHVTGQRRCLNTGFITSTRDMPKAMGIRDSWQGRDNISGFGKFASSNIHIN